MGRHVSSLKTSVFIKLEPDAGYAYWDGDANRRRGLAAEDVVIPNAVALISG